jgi:hypothetical protein
MGQNNQSRKKIILVELVPPPKDIVKEASGYVPIFISVLALAAAIYSAYTTRKHDRLSVKPSMYYFRELSPTEPRIGLSMVNNGLGPAIIEYTRFYVDGKLMNDWNEISAQMYKDGILRGGNIKWNIMYGKDNNWLKAGDTYWHFYADPSSVDVPRFATFFRSKLFAITKFCSVYGDCQYSCSAAPPDGNCLKHEDELVQK